MQLVLLVALLGIGFCIWVYSKCNYFFTLKAEIIHMQKPVVTAGILVERKACTESPKHKTLIAHEAFLRRAAYANTSIKTGESFYDDSDMQSDYYLIVVYDKKTNTPLLSGRYYYDLGVIAHYVKGDADQEPNEYNNEVLLNLNMYKADELFLGDRLSGNTTNSIYKRYRNYIFLLFYLKMLKGNTHCSFILMARKEKYERLLTKYLRLGLHVVGATKLRGKEHWILLGNIRKVYAQQKIFVLATSIMLLKVAFSKRK